MYECNNKFCFHNSNSFVYCCGICDQKGSAAFLNECKTNRRFKESLKDKANTNEES